MFEDSLFSSQARRLPARTRCTLIASIAAQGLTLAAALVLPLLWPATLPVVFATPKSASIMLRHPEVKPPPMKPSVVRITNASAVRAPSAPSAAVTTTVHGGSLSRLSPAGSLTANNDAPSLTTGALMGSPFIPGLGAGAGPAGSPGLSVVSAAPRGTGPVHISSGVSSGMLLQPIRPIYPRIAIAARQEGTVMMTATIDRSGHIVGLRVLSGPEMLRTAAVDAVQSARYKPYTLNGEATDVITTVSVTFRFSGSA